MRFFVIVLGFAVAALAYDRLRIMTWWTHKTEAIIYYFAAFVWGVGSGAHAALEQHSWYSLIGLAGTFIGLVASYRQWSRGAPEFAMREKPIDPYFWRHV